MTATGVFTLNVWDLKRDIVYKNDEMDNFMRALGIEDKIDHLHYDKVSKS